VLLVIFAVYGGVFSSSNATDNPIDPALSSITIVLFALLLMLWRHLVKYKEVNMVDLFPGNTGFFIMSIGLLVIYTFGILFIDPDQIPPFLEGQINVLILYLIFIIVFLFSAVNCRIQEILKPLDENTVGNYSTFNKIDNRSISFSWWLYGVLSLIFVAVGVVSVYGVPYILYPIIVSLLIGLAFGLSLFLLALKQAYHGANLLWITKVYSQ